MKTLITVISLMIFFQSAYAQYPETLNHNSLVNARDLDEDFLLFIPDTTTQILINPARAAAYDKSFIYTNYHYGSRSSRSSYINRYRYLTEEIVITNSGIRIRRSRSISLLSPTNYIYNTVPDQPDFSVFTLFKALGSKWLLNFSNGVSQSETESEVKDMYSYNYEDEPYDDNRIAVTSNETNSTAENSNTSIILSKIGTSSLGNYSVGFFASHSSIKSNETRYYNDNDHYLDHSGSLTRYRHQTTNRYASGINKGNIYNVGLSYSFNWENSDYMGRVSYQNSDILDYLDINENTVRVDTVKNDTIPDYLTITKTKILETIRMKNEFKPGSYQFYNYFQRKLDFISEGDQFFIKVKGFYSSEDKANLYDSRIYDEHSAYHFEAGQTLYQDTIDTYYNGKNKLDNWASCLSMGYLISYNLSDIYILSAFNPKIQIIHSEDAGVSSNVQKNMSELKEFSLTIPVYLSYSPKNWIELYGGINYNYMIEWSDQEYEFVIQRTYSPNRVQITTRKANAEYESIQSSKNSYLGVTLKHKSGLKCMIYFGNDITYYKTWNISLGYHF